MTDPGGVSRVGFGFIIFGDCFWRAGMGSINEGSKVIAYEKSLELGLPGEIIGRSKLLNGVNVHDNERFGGLTIVGNGVGGVSHDEEDEEWRKN